MSGSKKLLLTGGRAPVTLDLARLLSASGHQVMVAETTKYHLCRFSKAVTKSFVVPAPLYGPQPFANAIIELVKRYSIDMIIPMCEEIFALATHHRDISEHCPLLCDPLLQLERLHNKKKFIAFLKQRGFPYPETILLKRPEDVKQIPKRWVRVVLKPVYSRFARQVIIGNTADLDKIKVTPTDNHLWIAQEFIEGKRLCTYSVAQKGNLVAHVTYPITHCIGEIGSALAFQSITQKRVFALVQGIVHALSFTGQIGFDLIEREDGSVVPIECNPRATSGMHLFTSDDQLPAALLEDKAGAFPPEGRQKHLALPLLFFGGLTRQPKLLLRTLFRGKDVIFRPPDLLPGLISPALIAYYGWQAFRKGMTMTEASTYDIEWNGETCGSL